MTKRCYRCEKDVETHGDGSFVMHARDDGSLCRGTNCTAFEAGFVKLGGVKLAASRIMCDPDESLDGRHQA